MFGETDAQVGGALAQALAAGLTPVLCVGETLEERDAGQTEAVIVRQLEAGLDAGAGPEAPLILAYEAGNHQLSAPAPKSKPRSSINPRRRRTRPAVSRPDSDRSDDDQ